MNEKEQTFAERVREPSGSLTQPKGLSREVPCKKPGKASPARKRLDEENTKEQRHFTLMCTHCTRRFTPPSFQ